MHTSVLQHEYVWVYIFCLKSRRSDCPLPGRCNTPSVVYRATVRRHDNCAIDSYTGLYTGLTGGKFKDRFNRHQSDFRNKKRTASKLANHICKLQDQGTEYDTRLISIESLPKKHVVEVVVVIGVGFVVVHVVAVVIPVVDTRNIPNKVWLQPGY